MLYEMRLVGLAMDPFSNSPIVILKDKVSAEAEARSKEEGEPPQGKEEAKEMGEARPEYILPIWIGEAEANAIATELLGIVPTRPMTHDLIRDVLSLLNAEVHRVIVNDLQENTFFAQIELVTESGEILTLDARPSDALALALRCKADIFVEEKVLEKTMSSGSSSEEGESEAQDSFAFDEEKWKEMLGSFSKDSLGKYKQ